MSFKHTHLMSLPYDRPNVYTQRIYQFHFRVSISENNKSPMSRFPRFSIIKSYLTTPSALLMSLAPPALCKICKLSACVRDQLQAEQIKRTSLDG